MINRVQQDHKDSLENLESEDLRVLSVHLECRFVLALIEHIHVIYVFITHEFIVVLAARDWIKINAILNNTIK